MKATSSKKLSDIQSILRKRIFAGEWKVGDRLPTDFELAKHLGCSIGTVSKALGLLAHDGIVERKTKAGTKILRTAGAPRVPGIDLDAFAFIYPSDRHEGISGMLHGFEGAARKASRRLVTIPTGLDLQKETEIIARLEEFDVRGAVLCPMISCPQDQLEVSQLLLRVRVPVVLIGLNLPGFSAASVLLDNFAAGYEMTRYLLGRGCKRIGFLSNYSWMQFMRDRFSGYRRAMEEAGVGIRPDWVHLASAMHPNLDTPTVESTEIAGVYLKGGPSVDAVVCADDFIAVGLTKAAAGAGLRIPRDLMVTGIDDFSISQTSRPPLTTYHVPYDTMGQRSFELLQSLVDRNETGGEVFVRGEIVARESA